MPPDLEQACSTSLQRSRARRRAVAERLAAVRRRRRGGGVSAAVVAGVMAFGAPLALAHRTQAPTAPRAHARAAVLSTGSTGAAVRAVQRGLGVRVTGRFGPITAKAVRRFQRRNGLEVDGVVGPKTRAALRLAAQQDTSPPPAPASPEVTADANAPAVDAQATLARIAECESGGDPTKISPDGRYRGKYQFTLETWASLGGDGDPAAAPEAEQDARAADLLAQRGTDPWPACGAAR